MVKITPKQYFYHVLTIVKTIRFFLFLRWSKKRQSQSEWLKKSQEWVSKTFFCHRDTQKSHFGNPWFHTNPKNSLLKQDHMSISTVLIFIFGYSFVIHGEIGQCEVPSIGFGTAFTFTDPYTKEWKYESCLKCIKDALDTGYRRFDLAELYVGSEETMNRALKDTRISRKDVHLTSKIMPPYSFKRTIDYFNDSSIGGYFDSFLIHWIDENWETAWRAMEQLYDEGRIFSLGVSNFNQDNLEYLFSIARVPINEVQNFVDPVFQYRDLRKWCASNGISYIAYSSLAHFRYSDVKEYKRARQIMSKIGEKYGISSHQVILSWQLAEGISVIPLSRNKKHMQENLIVKNISLTKEDLLVIATLELSNYNVVPEEDCELHGGLVVC